MESVQLVTGGDHLPAALPPCHLAWSYLALGQPVFHSRATHAA